MKQEKLKGCPFCGVEAELCTSLYGFVVACSGCPQTDAVEKTGTTEEKAIEAWNARAGGWQTFDTAPKDGTEFQCWLVSDYTGDGHCDTRCKFDDHGTFVIWGRVEYDEDGWDAYRHLNPSHWQPLPLPPEGK